MSTTIVYHKFHCYCTHFLCFHSKITMLFFSCARDENFQIKKYIIPVLTIYLVPLFLFYLNLLPLPRSRSSYLKSRTNETKDIPIVEEKRTICGNEPLYYKEANEKGCQGANCNSSKSIECPRESDHPSKVFCCHHIRNDEFWFTCCDAEMYGVLNKTTSNVIFIFLLILSQILSLVLCPCSPVFRKFRNILFWICTKKRRKGGSSGFAIT